MKKLIEELEKEKQYQTAQKTFAGYWYAKGLDLALQIVKSYNPWIPIAEKLPPIEEEPEFSRNLSIAVLIRDQDGHYIDVDWYDFDLGKWENAKYVEPTHWTYLPEVKP